MSETRFTERAQAALRLAQECSAELGHGYVGSEHLLLGLAREGKGVAAKVLQSAGLEPESLKAAIARMVGVGAPGGAPSQGITPRCKKIIELAMSEASCARRRAAWARWVNLFSLMELTPWRRARTGRRAVCWPKPAPEAPGCGAAGRHGPRCGRPPPARG